MAFIGEQLRASLICNGCGKPMEAISAQHSAFWLAHCNNEECKNVGVWLTVEKASSSVIAHSPMWEGYTGRLYPVLVDADGKQVWPEKKE